MSIFGSLGPAQLSEHLRLGPTQLSEHLRLGPTQLFVSCSTETLGGLGTRLHLGSMFSLVLAQLIMRGEVLQLNNSQKA